MTIHREPAPKPTRPAIDLRGPEGNAFALLGFARRWCRDLGLDHKEFIKEATSGDYDHLVETAEDWFGAYVDFYWEGKEEEDTTYGA